MTPADKAALKSGAFYTLAWGSVVAVATNGRPVGLILAAVVALVAGSLSTGVRLPASLLRDGAASLWGGTKNATGLWSKSVPVSRVLPLLLVVAFAGKGCDGVTIPDVKWPDFDWRKVVPVVTPKPVVAEPLWFMVVRESEDDTPEVSRVLKDFAFWQSLRADGHFWRHYDDDQPEVASGHYLDALKRAGVSEPGLLILKDGSASSEPVKVVPLPKSTADIAALKKEITGR